MANNRNNETVIKVRIVLFLIIFLLMVAVIFSLLSGTGETGDKAESTGTEDVAETPDAAPETEETQAPSAEPAATSTPEPTPAPTPTPTPTPTPEPVYGDKIGGGTLTSETGVSLNLKADWTAVTKSADTVELTVRVYVEHSSLSMIAVPYAVRISVNGETGTMDVPAVDYTDSYDIKQTEIGTKTYTVNLAEGGSVSVPVSIEWHYGGTYGKTVNGEYTRIELETISCGGTIGLAR